jgi:hypothetical protein
MKGMAIDAAAANVARRGLVLLDDLRSVGVSEDAAKARVRAGLWSRRASGLFVINAAPHDWRQDLLAAQLAAGPRAAVARFAATAFWEIPGFPEGPVDTMNPYGCNHSPAIGRLRQSCALREDHIVVRDGIRVTRPSRTLFDIAPQISAARLERACSNAIAMRLTSEEALRTTVYELGKRGRPGTAAMRTVLGMRDSGRRADSGLELRFLDALDAEGLPIPECQVWLGDDNDLIGRVDFYWRPSVAVGEVDSERYHDGPMDAQGDVERDARLRAAGFRVERFPESEIRNRPTQAAARARVFLEVA